MTTISWMIGLATDDRLFPNTSNKIPTLQRKIEVTHSLFAARLQLRHIKKMTLVYDHYRCCQVVFIISNGRGADSKNAQVLEQPQQFLCVRAADSHFRCDIARILMVWETTILMTMTMTMMIDSPPLPFLRPFLTCFFNF